MSEAGLVAAGDCQILGLGFKADEAGLWDLMLWEHPMANNTLQLT